MELTVFEIDDVHLMTPACELLAYEESLHLDAPQR
jgi:hypothetical protein